MMRTRSPGFSPFFGSSTKPLRSAILQRRLTADDLARTIAFLVPAGYQLVLLVSRGGWK
jgi:hypothetical protein